MHGAGMRHSGAAVVFSVTVRLREVHHVKISSKELCDQKLASYEWLEDK